MTRSLRILVPVKRVIDYAIKPRVRKDGKGIEKAGVKHSNNPFDQLCIEEAVRLRERKVPVEAIVAVSAGPPKCHEVLRTALGMGADKAIHVDMSQEQLDALEPLTLAHALAGIAREEKSNLVLLGKQAIDSDQGQTGQMLAGLLEWPQATQASRVEVASDLEVVKVTREVDGGAQTVEASLPMVVTADLRLNEPRHAALPSIMKAKKKPITRRTLEELGVEDRRTMTILDVKEPPARQAGRKVADVAKMVAKIKALGV